MQCSKLNKDNFKICLSKKYTSQICILCSCLRAQQNSELVEHSTAMCLWPSSGLAGTHRQSTPHTGRPTQGPGEHLWLMQVSSGEEDTNKMNKCTQAHTGTSSTRGRSTVGLSNMDANMCVCGTNMSQYSPRLPD